MVNITLTNHEAINLFNYHKENGSLFNNNSSFSGNFDQGKNEYFIYTYDLSFNVGINESGWSLAIYNKDGVEIVSPTINTSWSFSNNQYKKFYFQITNSSVTYKINIIMVPKIEIKETYDSPPILIFDRIGFITEGSSSYKLIDNTTWYVKVYNDINLDLNYSFEYESQNSSGEWELELKNNIYNDELLINSNEIKIKFNFYNNDNSGNGDFSMQFNKALKNVFLKKTDNTDLNFNFQSKTMHYTIAIPEFDSIKIITEFFAADETWDISYTNSNNIPLTQLSENTLNIEKNIILYIYHRGDPLFQDYYIITIKKFFINDIFIINDSNEQSGNYYNELTNRFDVNKFEYFLSLLNVTNSNKKYDISFNYYTPKTTTYKNGTFVNEYENKYYFSYNSNIKQIETRPSKYYTILFNNSPTIFYLFNDFHSYKFELNHGIRTIEIKELDSVTNETTQLINFNKDIYNYTSGFTLKNIKLTNDYDITDISYNFKYFCSNTENTFNDDPVIEKLLESNTFDINMLPQFSYHKLFFKLKNNRGNLSYTIFLTDLQPISNIKIKVNNEADISYNNFFRFDEDNYVIPYNISNNINITLDVLFNLSKTYEIYKYDSLYNRSTLIDTFQDNDTGGKNPKQLSLNLNDILELVNKNDDKSKYLIKFINDPIQDINIMYNNKDINYNFVTNTNTYDFIPILNTVNNLKIKVTFKDTHINPQNISGIDNSNNGIIYYDISLNGISNVTNIYNNRYKETNIIDNTLQQFDVSFVGRNMNISLNNKIINEYAVFSNIASNLKEQYKVPTLLNYNLFFYRDLVNNILIHLNDKNLSYEYDIDDYDYYYPIHKNDEIKFKIDSAYNHVNNTFKHFINGNNIGDISNNSIISFDTERKVLLNGLNKIELKIIHTINNDISYNFIFDKSPIDNLNIIINGNEDANKNILHFDSSQNYQYYLSLNQDDTIAFNVNVSEKNTDISFNYSLKKYNIINDNVELYNQGVIDQNSNSINLTKILQDNLLYTSTQIQLTNHVNSDVSYNIYIDKILYNKIDNKSIHYTDTQENIPILDLQIFPFFSLGTNVNTKQGGYFKKEIDEVSGSLYINKAYLNISQGLTLNSIWYIDLSGNLSSNENYFVVQYIGEELNKLNIGEYSENVQTMYKFKIIAPYHYLDFNDDNPFKLLIQENIIEKNELFNLYLFYIINTQNEKPKTTNITKSYVFENMIYFSLFYRNKKQYQYNGYLNEYQNNHFIANNDYKQPPHPLNKGVIEDNIDYWFCFYEPLVDHSGIEISFETPENHYFSEKGILNEVLYNNYKTNYGFDNLYIYDETGVSITKLKWASGEFGRDARKYIYFQIKDFTNYDPNNFKIKLKPRISEYLPKSFGKKIYNPNNFDLIDLSGYYDFTINVLGLKLESSTSGRDTLHVSKNYSGTDYYYFKINYPKMENIENSLFPTRIPRIYYGFRKPFENQPLDISGIYLQGVQFIENYTIVEEFIDLYLIKDQEYNYLTIGYDNIPMKMFSKLEFTSDTNDDGVVNYKDILIDDTNIRMHKNFNIYFMYNSNREINGAVPTIDKLPLYVSTHDENNNKFMFDSSLNKFTYNNQIMKNSEDLTDFEEVYLSWLFYNMKIDNGFIKFADIGLTTDFMLVNFENILNNIDEQYMFYQIIDKNRIITDNITFDTRGVFLRMENNELPQLCINFLVNDISYFHPIIIGGTNRPQDYIERNNNGNLLYNYNQRYLRNLQFLNVEKKQEFMQTISPSGELIKRINFNIELNENLTNNILFNNLKINHISFKSLFVQLNEINNISIECFTNSSGFIIIWTGNFPENINDSDLTTELYFLITRINEKKQETITKLLFYNSNEIKKWRINNTFEYHDSNIEPFANYIFEIKPFYKARYNNKELIISQDNISDKNRITKYACYNNKHIDGRYSTSGLTQNQIFADLSRKRLIKK